jgi:hypothetical protein
MRALLAVAVMSALLVGCSKPAPEANTGPAAKPPGAAPSGSGAGDIAPVGPNVGGITPVTGDLGGTTGGGVGQAMKDRARNVAGQSNGQTPPPDDYGDEIGDQ